MSGFILFDQISISVAVYYSVGIHQHASAAVALEMAPWMAIMQNGQRTTPP